MVAVGASGEEALARLENERLFEWSHVSRDWYQWWWYDRAAEPLAQRSLEYPSEPLVAELRPPVPALEQVREVATRHGVELPDPSGPTAGLLVSRAGDRSLSVLADGRYELSLAVPNAANAAALSIDDARRRASELIGEHGLDRDVDLEFDSVRRTMSAEGPPEGDRLDDPRVLETAVQFRQIINGRPVVAQGAGAVRITLDNDSRLTRIENATRNVERFSTRPKRTVQDPGGEAEGMRRRDEDPERYEVIAPIVQ